ncbi:hypothetical protein WA158_000822 [Blastocystis sp. Blastoise]
MSDNTNSKVQNKQEMIAFIFQDEVHVDVPLAIIKKYPKCLLSVIYENPNNYLNDENSYYIDCPCLSINTLLQFIAKEIFLESMTINDIINMYKTIQFYFTDKHPDFEGKVFSYLVNQFYMVLKQTGCEIERIDFNNFFYLRMKNQFSEDIPYEYIYPSNLQELFPKLQCYYISFDYYPELECFRVPPSDFHYNELYSIYKQNYYNKGKLLLFNTYLKRLTENKLLKLAKKQLVVYTKIDFWKQLKNRYQKVDEHLYKGTLLQEYDNAEDNEYKPDLYVECYSNYSRKYNKHNKKQLNDKYSYSISFSFQNEQEFPNELIGLLTFSKNYYVDKIASYICNIPKCKQLNIIHCLMPHKKEEENKCISDSLSIPALLSTLNNGIFDNLETMNISTFIENVSYEEYKDLFVTIIYSHTFPNLTTLSIFYNMEDSTQYIFYKSLFLSFSRDHYPHLHILNISSYYANNDSESLVASMKDIYILFDSSLFELIDTIILDDIFQYYIIKYSKEFVDVLINAYKKHPFTLKLTSLNLNKYSIYCQQLLESNILLCEELELNTASISDFGSKEVLPDLSNTHFNKIDFIIDSYFSKKIEQQFLDRIKTINCHNLEEIHIIFKIHDSINENYNNIFQMIKSIDFISLFSCLNYNTVTRLSIDTSSARESFSLNDDNNQLANNEDVISFQQCLTLFSSNIKFLRMKYSSLCDMIYVLQNFIELPLWENIEKLSICFSLIDSIQPILSYIEFIQNNASLSFPKLDSFYINFLFSRDYSNHELDEYNIFKSFPSFSFYLHIPITEIYMHSQLVESRETSYEYCQYIYNQLQMEYTKTVSTLHIIMQNNDYFDEIINLIVNGKFPFLKGLEVLFCAEYKIDEIKQLLNNYMKTSNHWFIFFIKESLF